VPEIAARAHAEIADRTVAAAMREASIGYGALDGVAATSGPGLIGGVLVGMMTGKAVAQAAGKPFIAVNHLEGHALSPRLGGDCPFPYLLLLVSGGHCQFLEVRGLGQYKRLGSTIDDAVGEAFDKTAKLLGLPYPGGPHIDRLARQGKPGRFALPRPLLKDKRPVFSFSGLKTAVRLVIDGLPQPLSEQDVCDVCRDLQDAIVDVLAGKLFALADDLQVPAVYLAGGVAANGWLQDRVQAEADRRGVHFIPPKPLYCTDNAAMIALAGYHHLAAGRRDSLSLDSFARAPLTSWR